MNAYWLSWYHPYDIGQFELHAPWWISGERMDPEAATIVAAVRAENEDAAKQLVVDSYDTPPDLEWRFCDVLDRSPFSDRFPQTSEWMTWEEDRTCNCEVCRS
jgi:hypothetical protein